MSTKITEDCINCGACEPECPNEAISQGADIYVIDAERCTECVGFHAKEACQAVCPVECCVPDDSRKETEADLLARAVALHPENAELKSAAASGRFESRFRA
jgi:ferredoxin